MRDWYRTDCNMTYDPAVVALRAEFGILGELAWRWFLDLMAREDGGVETTLDILPAILYPSRFEPPKDFDLRRWITRATRLGLVTKARAGRTLMHLTATRWDEYNPPYTRRDAVAERKRRSRARALEGGHSDVTVTSRTTDRQTDRQTRNGRVSHDDKPKPVGEDVRKIIDEAKKKTAPGKAKP